MPENEAYYILTFSPNKVSLHGEFENMETASVKSRDFEDNKEITNIVIISKKNLKRLWIMLVRTFE